MKFLWPAALMALGLIPLLILLFAWQQRRRRRFAVRYSSLSLVRAALPAQSRVRRYLPMALFLLALAGLVVGLARPVAVTRVPAGRATVVLALDVSGSMRATDIAPSRLAAARQAALGFIDRQRNTNQVGIVAFAGIAQLVQAPTSVPDDLQKAIRNLTTGRGTAIGDGIVTALETIAEFGEASGGEVAAGSASGEPAPGAERELQPHIIVLLTDGVYTRGTSPLEAAQMARESGVRVYTIGFGTDNGSGGEDFDFRRRFGIDEESLKAIAAITGGEYYAASGAGELQKVFDSLPTLLHTRLETVEISVVFAALAALLVTGAVLLGQLWHPLP